VNRWNSRPQTADVLKVISRSTLDSKPNLEPFLERWLRAPSGFAALRGATYSGTTVRPYCFAPRKEHRRGFRDGYGRTLSSPAGSLSLGERRLSFEFATFTMCWQIPSTRCEELVEYQSFRSALGGDARGRKPLASSRS